MNRLTIFIAVSVLLHLLLQSGLLELADLSLRARPPQQPTEIELVEAPKSRATHEKAIVKQLDPLNQVDNDNAQARFDSEKTQRVAKETQTRNIGLTQNGAPQSFPIKNPQPRPARPSQPQPQREFSSDGELPEFTRMNYSRNNNNRTSAISQLLPSDIQMADATNLNTDANTYYSFYSRVEELFYVRWGERLDYYWNRLSFDFKKRELSGRVWYTTIEVLLTARGEYSSSKIFQSSGYAPFDEAAVFAFKDARFFPNPPKAKVEADGFVRLRYRLAVHVGNLP